MVDSWGIRGEPQIYGLEVLPKGVKDGGNWINGETHGMLESSHTGKEGGP